MSAISIDFTTSTSHLACWVRPKNPDRAMLETVCRTALGVIERLGGVAPCVEVIKVRFSQRGHQTEPEPRFEVILSVAGVKATIDVEVSTLWFLRNSEDASITMEEKIITEVRQRLGSMSERYMAEATTIRNLSGQIKVSD